MGSEESLINRIRKTTETIPELTRHLACGIGDDAAVLLPFSENLTVTTDMLCDGVDFICGKDTPETIGRKSLAVNLSDLAAMGAVPLAAVISVLLPNQQDGYGDMPISEFAERFYQGMIPLAKRFQVSMAGGDTNCWKGPFAVSITAMGKVDTKKAFYRSGAKPGDRILLTGPVGGSIFQRQFQFTPRLLEALYLSRYSKINGALDISDGLERDLSRMARESGIGYRLNLDAVPIHRDVLFPPPNANSYPGWKEKKTAIEHALSDGEDFELILAVPPAEAERLVAEQPFMAAAKGDTEPLRCIREICSEHHFSLTEEEQAALADVRLTDIGVFTSEKNSTAAESGWEYNF